MEATFAMTIAVDWDDKHQFKHTKLLILTVNIESNLTVILTKVGFNFKEAFLGPDTSTAK